MKSLSVIMPALNEAPNIRAAINNVLEKFREFGVIGEIILVNDGSTDDTEIIMREMQKSFPDMIKIIRHETPQGIGASFWDGVNSAKEDVVVMMPGDGENDSGEIIKYLFLTEYVDIVNPYVVNKRVRSMQRNILSDIFLKIINITFFMNLKYTNGTVMYRRESIKMLVHKETGFFYQVELLVKSIKHGCLYAEVPYMLRKRATGESKALTFRSLINIISGYLSLFLDVYFEKS